MAQRRRRGTSGDDTITVRGVSFEALAADYPLAWPPPYSQTPGDHFEYWWHMIQYAFDLPDPRAFAPLPPGLPRPDLAVLARYVAAADDLAESPFLSHPTGLTVSIGPNSEEDIVAAFPPSENIRGFSVLLRQFHSNDESASFNNAQAALRRANKVAADGSSEQRLAEVTEWGRAVGQLRAWQLKVLVGRRLHREGRFGPGPYPGEERSPETLLSLYHYGEDIHWGRQRENLAALGQDSFTTAWTRMSFFEAAAALAHVYLGFAELVRAAIRQQQPAHA